MIIRDNWRTPWSPDLWSVVGLGARHRHEHENGYGGCDRRSRSSVRLAIEPVRLRFGAHRLGYLISLCAQERFASTT